MLGIGKTALSRRLREYERKKQSETTPKATPA
jgi:hypothetical protein